MAVVGVVLPVGDAPAVVGHQDGGVGDVTHKVVQLLVVAEALVPAALHNGGGAGAGEGAHGVAAEGRTGPETRLATNRRGVWVLSKGSMGECLWQ